MHAVRLLDSMPIQPKGALTICSKLDTVQNKERSTAKLMGWETVDPLDGQFPLARAQIVQRETVLQRSFS